MKYRRSGKMPALASPAAETAREPGSVRPYFESLLLLLLAAGFLTLAGTGRLSLPIVAIGVVVLALRAVLLWLGIRPRLSNSFSNVVSVLYLIFYPIDVYIVSRGFLPATVHLVLLVAVVKLFSASRPRDFAYLCVLAFLEVLAAATLTVGSAFLAYFTVFLVLTVATVISYEVFRAESAAPVRAAATGGKRLGASPSLRRALFSVSVAAAACVALCAAGLFFVLPRFAFGYWNPNPGVRRLSGFSDDVRLGEIGDLQRSNVPVLHIRVDASLPPSPPGDIFWRLQGRVLTEFDGWRWYDPHRALVMPTRFGRLPLAVPSVSWAYPHRFLRYTVSLEPVGADVLFVAPRLHELSTRMTNIGLDATGTLNPLGRGYGGLVYSALSDLGQPSDQELMHAGRHYPPLLAGEDLELPPHLDPRIPALARSIVGRRTAPIAQMRALEAYLRTHYRYTLNLRIGSAAPLSDFLFRVRAGHCEYFASALAVLGRTLGIPTRVVNGFVGGEYNDFSGEYVLRGRDAHSWVEAYFPALGGGGLWLPFDGTAGDPAGAAAPWTRAQMYWDALQSFWQEWVINYDFFHQLSLARSVRREVSDRAQSWAGLLSAGTGRTLAALAAMWAAVRAGEGAWRVGLLVLLVLLAGFAAFWGGPWRNPIVLARRPAALASEATRYYRRLQRQLRRHGSRRGQEQTAEELLASLPARLRAGAQDGLERFVRHYQQVRFGADGSVMSQLADDLRLVRQQLKAIRN